MGFSTLWIGVSGLQASQRALEVATHNISNVNTEGYSRQRAELRSAKPAAGAIGAPGTSMRGMGVTVADVVRIRSTLVDTAVRSELANTGFQDTRAQLMSRAEGILGPIDGGVPTALDEFFAAWDRLSLSPDDSAARRSVLDAGATLASGMRAADAQLSRVTSDIADQIAEQVGEVNRLVDQIGKLNGAIADQMIGGQVPSDLMDQRDILIDKVTEIAGTTTTHADELGRVDVYLGTRALVQGERVEHLAPGGVLPEIVTWELGGATAKVKGRLGAFVEVGTATVPALRADLDNIATGLRDVVNAAHQAGFDLDGNPGVDFFTATGAADLMVNTAVGVRQVAASESGAPNDGNNAITMAGLRDAVAVGTDSARGALRSLAGRLGNLALDARNSAQTARLNVEGLKKERAEISSVSVDEELADMIRYQRSYEAAARIITTVDQMLDRLINNTGLVGR